MIDSPHNDDLKPWHCGAKNRAGKPCHGMAMANGRCKNHGGKSLPPGPGHPAYKHGRQSKAFASSLPPRLREKFEQAMDDPELLSLRRFVAYYDAELLAALERYQASDAGQYRTRLLEKWIEFKVANSIRAEGDEDRAAKAEKMTEIFNDIDRIIATGADEVAVRAEVDAAIRSRMAATSQEQRRLVDAQQFLTVEQAYAFIHVLYSVLESKIPDRAVRSRIGEEISRRLGIAGPTFKELAAEKAANAAMVNSPAGDHGDVLDVESVEPAEPPEKI